MGLTHDGLQTPLPPNRAWQLGGLLTLLAGIAWCVQYGVGAGLCVGLSVALVGALILGDQMGGVLRVRVTFSKLLVERERPVRGFLIGPAKDRIPWEEFQGVEIADGKVVARGKSTTLELGAGRSEAELKELARKIRSAAERFASESANPG
jgi:hypothetical protein